MRTRYLLHCSCGEKIEVDPVQAGQAVRCICGASVDIPTMRELASLPRVEPDRGPRLPSTRWGIRQRLVLIGVVLAVSGLGFGTYFFLSRPASPEAVFDAGIARQMTDSFTPLQSWQVWDVLRRGLNKTPPKQIQRYHAELATHHAWMTALSIVAALGVITVVVSLLIPIDACILNDHA